MRLEVLWNQLQRCPHCGAILTVTSQDLFGREGVVSYRCPSCETVQPYDESGLHALPPFVRESALARVEP